MAKESNNILQYVPRLRPREYVEDHLEVVMIVDCEETRQLIMAAGFDRKETSYG